MNDFSSLVIGGVAGLLGFVSVLWRMKRKHRRLLERRIEDRQRKLPFGSAEDPQPEEELVAR